MRIPFFNSRRLTRIKKEKKRKRPKMETLEHIEKKEIMNRTEEE